MALRAASAKRDVAALDRLVKLGELLGDDSLTQAARLARSASRAPKTAEQQLTMALDKMSPEEFAQVRGLLSQIETARTTEDRETLQKLEKNVRQLAAIDPRVRM